MLRQSISLLRQPGPQSIVRNTGWLCLGQGSSLLFQLLYFAALARLLGPAQYGIFVGAFAFTSIVAQYSSLGMGTIFIRYVAGNKDRFAVYWGNVLLVTATGGSLLALVLTLIGRALLNPASATIVLVAAVANCCFAQLTTECSRVFQTFEQMGTTAFVGFVTNLVRAFAAGGMLLILHHATAAMWATTTLAISFAVAIAGVVVTTVRFGRPRFVPTLVLEHLTEGAGYAFATSTSAIYNDIDKTMLSHYGMNLANGIYSLAYRVIDLASLPLFALRNAVLPRLFRDGHKGIEASAELSHRLLKVAVPGGVVVSGCMLLSAPLIPRLLGSGFAESATALRWLCLIPVFRSIHQMTGSALTGAGLQRYRTSAQVFAAAFNLGLNLWLIPVYSWKGAAFASLITDGGLAVICSLLLHAIRVKSRIAGQAGSRRTRSSRCAECG